MNIGNSDSFDCGTRANSQSVFMRISVLFLSALFAVTFCTAAKAATTNIKVDQVGYLPDAPKIALVDSTGTGSSSATSFALKRTSDNAVVLEGKLSSAVHDTNSGDQVQSADFSAFRKSGH